MSNSNKNIFYVEAYIINIYAKFQFSPIMASQKKIFEYLFRKCSLSVAMATNQNQRLGQNS